MWKKLTNLFTRKRTKRIWLKTGSALPSNPSKEDIQPGWHDFAARQVFIKPEDFDITVPSPLLEAFKKPFPFFANNKLVLNERGGYELVKHLEAHDFKIIPMLDVNKSYKTECGYRVRNLTALIFKGSIITYEGQFLGSENIWFSHVWQYSMLTGERFNSQGWDDLVVSEDENVEPV